MLRCRNEGRWLGEVLASIRPLTPDILILDDYSTDNTWAVAEAAGAVVIGSPFAQNQPDESRDKSYLLWSLRRRFDPHYVLCIDGDEVLSAGSADLIRAKLNPLCSIYSFPIRYLWNDRNHYRADGVYGPYQRASMFSLVGAGDGVTFRSTAYGSNFHCGNVPAGLKGTGAAVAADLLHLGYMDKADRVRKYEWYNQRDPHNQYEDRYRHMVIGDLFPADARFVHGGPLKIFTLAPNKWPDTSCSLIAQGKLLV
jgi:glycosyltransferase involved in cell wall biosynthesis